MATDLNGHALISMVVDTLRAPEGTMAVTLDSSQVREFHLDSLRANLAIRRQRDPPGYAGSRLGRSRRRGTRVRQRHVGVVSPHDGKMTLAVQVGSLAPFDSLLLAMTGTVRDTTPRSAPLGGSATADFTLAGSLDSLQAVGQATVAGFPVADDPHPGAVADLEWTGGRRARASLARDPTRYWWVPGRIGRSMSRMDGWTDSLSWAGSLEAGTRADLSGGRALVAARRPGLGAFA